MAQLFTQKYFPFSKMDKKNVQKRKPKILFKKKPRRLPPTENITTCAVLLYFLTENDANGSLWIARRLP